jgi:citronellol/citronellal dehydrogenase
VASRLPEHPQGAQVAAIRSAQQGVCSSHQEHIVPYRSVFAANLFKDQTIIVTGGGSGIGRCTAHELAALGANVAIVGRDATKLDTVAKQIGEDGGTVMTHVCDIRDEALVIRTIEAVLARHGSIQGLVNDAGDSTGYP